MSSISSIAARGAALLHTRDSSSMSSATMDLLIALLVLVFVALLCVAALFFIRRVRLQRAIARQSLPSYHESTSQSSNHISHRRSLTITTSDYNARSSHIYVYDEKASMLAGPPSPVPEIRITFPDEHDESGRPMSGRVVVVRVGENGVGLEPLSDEQLPKYEKENGERFMSLDMERIGGLKEKRSYA